MAELPGWMTDPIGTAERGENPTVLARMKSGYAVFGWSQFLPGYSLLLGVPKSATLEGMVRSQRTQFLDDMGLLGEAVAVACRPRRVNYSIYGNTDPYVHAHVVPRYDWEPPERVTRPIWEYGPEKWSAAEYAYDETRHGDLKRRIAEALNGLLKASRPS